MGFCPFVALTVGGGATGRNAAEGGGGAVGSVEAGVGGFGAFVEGEPSLDEDLVGPFVIINATPPSSRIAIAPTTQPTRFLWMGTGCIAPVASRVEENGSAPIAPGVCICTGATFICVLDCPTPCAGGGPGRSDVTGMRAAPRPVFVDSLATLVNASPSSVAVW